jgi:hypothetical protein
LQTISTLCAIVWSWTRVFCKIIIRIIMSGFQCCSIGLAVSNVLPVNAPANVLWEALTDFDALPKIVDMILSVKVVLPLKTSSQSQVLPANEAKERQH